MNISILGAGAWGTALALVLASKNQVILWGRNRQMMQEMQSSRNNLSYLPGFVLPPTIQATADFDAALKGADLVIIASSVSGLRPILQQCLPYQLKQVVWLCKGFEEGSQLLPHQVVRQVLGDQIMAGALSGPSFAQEVARGLPCALTIASTSPALCQQVVTALHGNAMRVYSSNDVVGVEVGGAVKNILAIATGVADGLGLGLNARAALMTRGLAEISRLSSALGGRNETLMGLTGVGDLILTCTGDLSRNRKVGLGLAQGKSLATIVEELGHVAEGVRCAQAVKTLAQKLGVEMPITEAVAGVLFDGVAAPQMIERLLARDARQEIH
ncbi:NAD(P)H-dependent glycerol-3-phosphate dehydrogenase [Undibacterium sp.]|uniref:NAD(P)H-dependent glycerol-3-phosphate dehydrogenase n=1 Tax=Undibacterium sp. TaxID=1914977 RepID=UPI0025F73D1C|nr:NAD(P)H-dependent glycerol-3-phosphate dehydrogenase [Undibacterium sp.]